MPSCNSLLSEFFILYNGHFRKVLNGIIHFFFEVFQIWLEHLLFCILFWKIVYWLISSETFEFLNPSELKNPFSYHLARDEFQLKDLILAGTELNTPQQEVMLYLYKVLAH